MQHHFPVTVSCSNLEISAIKSQNGVVENYVFRPQNFWGALNSSENCRMSFRAIGKQPTVVDIVCTVVDYCKDFPGRDCTVDH